MAEFDDFPVKPKFQAGDEVYYYPDEVGAKVCGRIRHIRASVGAISRKKDTPRISYGYTVDTNPTVIEEAAIFFVNPLLQFTREVHDGA
jgi:hypothetical protein